MNSIKKRLASIGLATLSFTGINLANADHFPKEIVIIGDSLSDSGNSRPSAYGSIFNPTARYTPITDGVPWPVVLAEKLETQQLLPYVQGGSNYAYVGSLTSGSFPLFPNPSLTEQEQTLLSPKTNRHSPVFIFGGANDIFFPLVQDPGIDAAINIGNILDDLHHKHYKTLIVLNLPDVGKIPSAGSSAEKYTKESLNFNSTILEILKEKDYPVLEVDLFSVFEKLIADPEAFGLSNSTGTPSLTPFLQGQPTAGFVFWYDGTHPTQATHRLIADYVLSIINAAGCYATLAEVPFGMLREQRTDIHQQLSPMQPLHEKYAIYPFVSGNYAPLLLPPLSDSCEGNDAHGGNVCAGLTCRIGDAWTIGAAGTYSTLFSKCHAEKNKCEFDLDSGILSLFIGFSRKHGYLNGIFNVAWLDYDKIKRKFVTGPYVNRTHADTNGKDYDAELYGAYYIWTFPHLKTGPLFDMNYQRVLVEGYKEKGADFGNLKYLDQGNTIFATGLGWDLLLEYDVSGVGFLTDFFLAANRQWLAKEHHIHFGEVSLPETYGSWPVRSHRNTYASGGVDLSIFLKSGPVFSLGYSFNIGTFDMSEQFITAGFTFPLGKRQEPAKKEKPYRRYWAPKTA